MSIDFGRWQAEGPYDSTASLQDTSGVYVILTRRGPTEQWVVIDVGESATVKSRVENHDRKDCWQRNSRGVLAVAVFYTPGMQQAGRMAIEQELRKLFNPPCGDR